MKECYKKAIIVDTPGKAALCCLERTIDGLLQLVDLEALSPSVQTGVIYYEYRVSIVRGELDGYFKPPGRAIDDLQETIEGLVQYMRTHNIPIPPYLMNRVRYYKMSIVIVRRDLKTLV